MMICLIMIQFSCVSYTGASLFICAFMSSVSSGYYSIRIVRYTLHCFYRKSLSAVECTTSQSIQQTQVCTQNKTAWKLYISWYTYNNNDYSYVHRMYQMCAGHIRGYVHRMRLYIRCVQCISEAMYTEFQPGPGLWWRLQHLTDISSSQHEVWQALCSLNQAGNNKTQNLPDTLLDQHFYCSTSLDSHCCIYIQHTTQSL